MSLVDKAIEFVSPSWALSRERQRAALAFQRAAYAEYGGGAAYGRHWGAFQGRMERGWGRQPGITGQTWTDRVELASMRDRARMLENNNPIACGMLNRLTDNVVGEGFTLQMKAGTNLDPVKDASEHGRAQAWNAENEERWEEWLIDADVRGMMPGQEMLRLMHRGSERDGDTGMCLVSRGGVPRLQSIEADQIYQPDGEAPRPLFVDGVEMNRAGRPIRFHVLDCPQGGTRQFTSVPAENFIFLPRFKRYGNNIVRGTTCFETSFSKFDQADGYVDGVVIAARMATMFGLLFKEQTSAQSLQGLNEMPLDGRGLEKAFTLQDGMVRFVGPKDSVVQVTPTQPMQQTPDFVACLLRLIGLPVDMPLELVLLDFSRVNYSSARAAFLQFYQAMLPRQHVFRVKVMTRIFRWWQTLMIRQERFTCPMPPDFARHHFAARGWQWVNPVQEAQTALLEISMGVQSPQRVAARLGRNYEQILAELAADFRARTLLGLPVNLSAMTREAINALTTPAATGTAKPAEPTEVDPAMDDPEELQN